MSAIALSGLALAIMPFALQAGPSSATAGFSAAGRASAERRSEATVDPEDVTAEADGPIVVGVAEAPAPIAYVVLGGRSARLSPRQSLGGWRLLRVEGEAAVFEKDGRVLPRMRRPWIEATAPTGVNALTIGPSVRTAPTPAPAPDPAEPPSTRLAAMEPAVAGLAAAPPPPPAPERPPSATPRYWVGPPGSMPAGYVAMPAELLPAPPARQPRYQGG